MATTDGTKIAEFKILKENIIDTELTQIVSLKCVQFLDKILINKEEPLHFLIEKNRVMFAYDNYTIYGNTLEGPYPDYTAAYPKDENPSVLIVDKENLKTVIKRISLLASEDFMRIKFDLSENGELIINSFNRELGEGKETLKNIIYKGQTLSISLNYKHLLAILNVIDTDDVRMEFGTPSSPIMIYNTENNPEYAAKFLLMPLRRR